MKDLGNVWESNTFAQWGIAFRRQASVQTTGLLDTGEGVGKG